MDKETKSILLNLKLEDYNKIKEQAKQNRMTVTSYVRYVLLFNNKKKINLGEKMKTKLIDGLWVTRVEVKGVEIITSDVEYATSVYKAMEEIKKIK